MKYKNRLVVSAVLIFLLLIVLTAGAVVRGVHSYAFNNNLDSAYMIAEDTNVFINQSVGISQLNEQSPVLYSSSAEYYAQKTGTLYSVDVILYDTSFNVVGTNSTYADSIEYKAYASSVYETGQTSYVYTEIDGVNHIILFSNLKSTENVYGVCAIIKSMAATDLLISQITKMFCVIAAIMTAVCFVIFNAAYSKMLLPIKKLKEYNEKTVEEDEITLPDINYKRDDEIRELITSSENMAKKIGEKMNQLHIQNRKFEAVVSALEDGVLMVDERMQVILTNKSAANYLSGEDYTNVIPNIEQGLEDAFTKSKTTRGEYVYAEKNYLYTVVPVISGQESSQAMIVISDITAFKSLEAEQNKFISSVSHELKTPLTTIIGYVDLLRRRGTDDKRLTDKALDVTQSESRRLLRLVNDLLNINSYRSLDFDFIFTDVDVNTLIEEAVAEMNIKAEQNNMLIVYGSSDLPKVSGDYDRLKQVLLNVMDNALKYSHEQDIIRVTATYDEEMLEITVRDYGEGIPENVRSKVFDAFYRVGDDRSRLSGGFGLGLSIVKHIVQKHNGDVDIESILGQGTLVIIRLPVKKDEIIEIEAEVVEDENEDTLSE
ncbi:MAG: GHKL domain-containing protein [Anaerofustis stercorihominis]|nr:GHKL domain-containing protein [Anaerofustis stercorihominis]